MDLGLPRALRGRNPPAQEAARGRRAHCRSNPTGPSHPTKRPWRTSPGQRCPTTPTWSGTRPCSTSGSSIRSARTGPRFRFIRSSARLGLRVVTVLRFLPPGGAVRAFEFTGDPGLVRLDPRWHQAALRFVELGFFHILDGTDHLLFLFCLVIPFRRFRALIPVVTSFTVAHSITLIASAYNLGAGRAVVSAADRNSDRDLHRLHGARKHRRRSQRATPLDDRLRLRPGPRLRLLVRLAPDACSSPDRTCWRRCSRSISEWNWGSCSCWCC